MKALALLLAFLLPVSMAAAAGKSDGKVAAEPVRAPAQELADKPEADDEGMATGDDDEDVTDTKQPERGIPLDKEHRARIGD